mmetsp:Transcript_110741/g.319955  ORF Transcript_110741/g.319955 Transcript_110741/m.319955 type:complete len:272 (+) Transcript_110741:639-1454(+)
MTSAAPKARHTCMICMPTPPEPKTATRAPGWSAPPFFTAPYAVNSAQPTIAALFPMACTFEGILYAAFAGMTEYSAMPPMEYWYNGLLSGRASRGSPSYKLPFNRFWLKKVSQMSSLFDTHDGQWPQGMIKVVTTGSPTLSSFESSPPLALEAAEATPGPSSTISPHVSWPMTQGVGKAMWPFMTCRSEWHTPVARFFTSTSPARGFGMSTTCGAIRVLTFDNTAARIVAKERPPATNPLRAQGGAASIAPCTSAARGRRKCMHTRVATAA